MMGDIFEKYTRDTDHQAKPRGWGKYFRHTTNKDAVLAFSHYSDPAYDGDGQIIFGGEVKGMRYEYDDRLCQWDRGKHDAAWEAAAEEHGKANTARRIESYLRHYYDDPGLELLAIRTGTRPFDGYPWYAYGFKQSALNAAGGE